MAYIDDPTHSAAANEATMTRQQDTVGEGRIGWPSTVDPIHPSPRHDSINCRMNAECDSIDRSDAVIDQNKGGKGRVRRARGEERKHARLLLTHHVASPGWDITSHRIASHRIASIDSRIEYRQTGMRSGPRSIDRSIDSQHMGLVNRSIDRCTIERQPIWIDRRVQPRELWGPKSRRAAGLAKAHSTRAQRIEHGQTPAAGGQPNRVRSGLGPYR